MVGSSDFSLVTGSTGFDLPINSETRASSDYNFTISCDNNSHITSGGDSTGYYIEVNNTGTLQDSISLSYDILKVTGGEDPIPDDWEAELNKDVLTLNPGAGSLVILNVTATCSCQEDSVAHIRVAGVSANAPSITGYIDTFTEYGPDIEKPLVTLEKEDFTELFEISAGEVKTFSLAAYNHQSVTQSYILKTKVQPTGWPLEFLKSFEIPPYSKQIITVTTTIPVKNEPGNYKLIFDIQSENDPQITNDFDVTITLLPELTVENIKLLTPQPRPGEAVMLNYTIGNLGPAVARNFLVDVYNSTNRVEENLIDTVVISELHGAQDLTQNLTWHPLVAGKYNISVHVNANSNPKEVANRYGNNLKVLEVTITDPIIPGDGQDGDDGKSGGNVTKGEGEKLSPMFLSSVVAIVIVIVILILIFIFRNRFSQDDGEKTARKIPLRRGFSGRAPPRGKTAHKESLHGRSRRRNKGRGKRHKK